jgi:hypothetical protein
MKAFGLTMVLAISQLLAPAQPSQWQRLFDGQTLKGWHTIPGGQWTVKDGAIIGKNEKNDVRHGLLVSDKTYKNFVVRMKYKAIRGNSGFYFRVQETGDVVGVKGFQAEIDPDKDAGGLYETSGRAWVVQPKPADVKTWYKPNEWNEMTIAAQDGDITVTVNGKVSAQLANDPGLREGKFALQLHGSQDVEVMFRDIQIMEK